MSKRNSMTILDKWGTKYNRVHKKKDIQKRLRERLKKNAVDNERSGNKGG